MVNGGGAVDKLPRPRIDLRSQEKESARARRFHQDETKKRNVKPGQSWSFDSFESVAHKVDLTIEKPIIFSCSNRFVRTDRAPLPPPSYIYMYIIPLRELLRKFWMARGLSFIYYVLFFLQHFVFFTTGLQSIYFSFFGQSKQSSRASFFSSGQKGISLYIYCVEWEKRKREEKEFQRVDDGVGLCVCVYICVLCAVV